VGNLPEGCLYHIAYNEHKHMMYITTSLEDRVLVIAGLGVVGTIGVDDVPRCIAYNKDDRTMYTANHDDNDVSEYI
jgi:DNA-binding beta-propeller fold protein YncE